jgi:hypothetical protein
MAALLRTTFVLVVLPSAASICADGYGGGSCVYSQPPTTVLLSTKSGNDCCTCAPGAGGNGYYCYPCTSNTYSPSPGFVLQGGYTNCLPCPEGTFSKSFSTSCTTCVPGTFWDGSTCTSCPSGSYSTSSSSSCTQCPLVPSQLRLLQAELAFLLAQYAHQVMQAS